MDMPNKVICQYRVAAGNEEKFESLFRSHWPTLQKLGLVTEVPAQQYKGEEQNGGQPVYFEIFDWLDGAVDRAHEHPEVMAIFDEMLMHHFDREVALKISHALRASQIDRGHAPARNALQDFVFATGLHANFQISM